MKLKEKIKNKINVFKAKTSRFSVLSLDEWLNINELEENSENRALYTRYRMEIDEMNKTQDKNLSKFIGSALFLVVFLVIFAIMCANSIGATDVVANLTQENSNWSSVDNFNTENQHDNIYQIQRFQPESGVDFTFLYSYIVDPSALGNNGVTSYIYGVKNFEQFYQYLSRFDYDIYEMSNFLVEHYNYYEMRYELLVLIEESMDTWLDQINDTRTLGYNQGYDVGYEQGKTVGYEQGETVGYTNGYDEGYDVGHTNGYDEGYDVGKTDGYNIGYMKGTDEGETLKKGIFAIFDAPLQTLHSLLNFEVLGINFYSIFTFILTLALLGILTKTILGFFV